ncbi:HD-GYP domain-containing protein [Leptothrix discophora]|uniref:HD-GYP domain-containing protein n=1 Tax=Leptothrix discophora TaxID=89 RepID=A0ABT9G537_LEPDI|nr:HD-GYP domain-containing protein [Leptothrix discophora]MDP4301564.1 HD-GYP domain-containing protein [Leptothrix discophora]
MLKRIPVDQLRLGMFLHELCGSWMDHPFWRKKFLLQDPDDLRRVRECGIAEVWIDISRGHDVEGGLTEQEVAVQVERELEEVADQSLSTATPATPATPAPLRHAPVAPGNFAACRAVDEYGRAARIVDLAKQQVSSLYADARMGRVLQVDGCMPLVDDIIGSVTRNQGALASLVRLKTQDEYTYLHSVAVCTLMVALSRTLKLSDDEVRIAGLSGLLHDMGKARIPLAILNKNGRLTDDEFRIMKMHPVWGHEMLVAAGAPPSMVLDVCLHHHEKVDGAGYPKGLKAEQISIHARMGAVCDVYDAVTSVRPYKGAWDPGEAVRQMAQWKGHFDPAIFQAFVKTVGIYPVGTVVKLESGRIGVVLEQSEGSLLTPRVKVFFSSRSELPIAPETVDLARGADRIVGVEPAERWKAELINDLWIDGALPRR